jgi:hypothetical protein
VNKEKWKFFSGNTNKGLTWLLCGIAALLVIIAFSDNVYLKGIAAAWVILP